MLTFKSEADLSRLKSTNPAQSVVTKLADGLFSETQPITIALMEPHDIGHPLTLLSNAKDVSLEGIIERENMYLVVFQTDYGYGIVLAVPNEDWLSNELYQSINENLYH